MSFVFVFITDISPRNFKPIQLNFNWTIKPVQIQELNFEKAMEPIENWEGGYSNDLNDSGGETYCGISRVSYPNWEGWVIIDSYDNKKWNQRFEELEYAVKSFYYNRFWVKYRLNETNSQVISEKMLNISVNLGQGTAVKMLKKVLNDLNYERFEKLSINTNFDDKTMAILYVYFSDKQIQNQVVVKLNEYQKQYYHSIAKGKNQRYLKAWLKRTF